LANYNDVTDKLRQSHDVLQREVRRLHDELAHKNRQLERRKRLAALGEMAAGLAHEIRNPLGGIRLYADLLRRDLADRQELTQLVDKIINGVSCLDGLVGQVLAMSHTVEPRLHPVDLAAVVEMAVDLLGDQIRVHQTDISYHLPEGLIVVCDREMIQRAVLNVARNAIEAAGQGGRVMVDVMGKGRHAVVQIADSGPGIDPEFADKIFNPFFTAKDNGTGLGLTIVHRIIEAHEGTIGVGRSKLGGALFTLKLPVDGVSTMGVDPRGHKDDNDSGN
jgi:signal transduction histidine kinase